MNRLFGYAFLAFASAVLGFALYSWGMPYFSADNTTSESNTSVSRSSSSVVGNLRPSFSLPNLQGDMHAIEDWEGKVVLINFWATWCPPCRKEIPELDAIHQQYVGKGFEVLGLAFDETDLVARFVKDMDLHYPQLIADLSDSALMRDYGNVNGALPYSVLIDRKGIIRFIHSGVLTEEALERELLKLI